MRIFREIRGCGYGRFPLGYALGTGHFAMLKVREMPFWYCIYVCLSISGMRTGVEFDLISLTTASPISMTLSHLVPHQSLLKALRTRNHP